MRLPLPRNVYMRQLQMFQKVEYGGGPIFKVVLECTKGVLNLFLSISMAYNVISCQKVAENTQLLNSLCKSEFFNFGIFHQFWSY